MSQYMWASAWRHGLEQARRRMTTPDLLETLAYCEAHPGKLNRQDLNRDPPRAAAPARQLRGADMRDGEVA